MIFPPLSNIPPSDANKCLYPARRCDIENSLHHSSPRQNVSPSSRLNRHLLNTIIISHLHQFRFTALSFYPPFYLLLVTSFFFFSYNLRSNLPLLHYFFFQPPVSLLSLSLQTSVKCCRASILVYSSTCPSIHLYNIIHPLAIVLFSSD